MANLRDKGLISTSDEHGPRFELHRAGNPLIPIAAVAPAGHLQGHAQVYIHITAEEGTFKLSKLNPCKNSVRSQWYYGAEHSETGKLVGLPLLSYAFLS